MRKRLVSFYTFPKSTHVGVSGTGKGGVWVGHLLSGYSLPMDMPSQVNVKSSEEVAGMWKHSIKVSYEATKAAFPGGEVIAHLDHKMGECRMLLHILFLGPSNLLDPNASFAQMWQK
eukprot:XP_020401618.1 D-aminoacyl-tRNA deacylase isoform X2 [Zea mays]